MCPSPGGGDGGVGRTGDATTTTVVATGTPAEWFSLPAAPQPRFRVQPLSRGQWMEQTQLLFSPPRLRPPQTGSVPSGAVQDGLVPATTDLQPWRWSPDFSPDGVWVTPPLSTARTPPWLTPECWASPARGLWQDQGRVSRAGCSASAPTPVVPGCTCPSSAASRCQRHLAPPGHGPARSRGRGAEPGAGQGRGTRLVAFPHPERSCPTPETSQG